MNSINTMLQSVGLLVLRLGFGGAMLYEHGLKKLLGFSEMADKFGDPIGLGSMISLILATFAEFFCSVLIILGLGTRLAAVPLMVTMGVALFVVHAADPFSTKEKAALFLTAFTALLLTGGGAFSLDRVLSNWRKKSKQA